MSFTKLIKQIKLEEKRGNQERLEQLCHYACRMALAGNMSAIKWIFDQIEDPPQKRPDTNQNDEVRYIS